MARLNHQLKHYGLCVLAGLTGLGVSLPPTHAAEMSKTVAGMEVFYGVVPAEVISNPTKTHDPAMHGTKWRSKGTHHLVVSLLDAKTGERISDASVTAAVTPLGMAPSEKRLDPMLINGTTTYGNFFDMPPSSAPFRIALRITRPAIPAQDAVTAEFEYRPPASN